MWQVFIKEEEVPYIIYMWQDFIKKGGGSDVRTECSPSSFQSVNWSSSRVHSFLYTIIDQLKLHLLHLPTTITTTTISPRHSSEIVVVVVVVVAYIVFYFLPSSPLPIPSFHCTI